MSSEQNKNLVHRIETAVAEGDLNALTELYANNVIDNNPFPEQAPGLQGLKEKIAMINQAFPDAHTTIDLIVANEDLVIDRWTTSGTHAGAFMDIPATGNPVAITGISIYRFQDGKVQEEWTEFDGIGLLAQIGALSG